jgi:membrane protein YqaA with SNARE-associated domain
VLSWLKGAPKHGEEKQGSGWRRLRPLLVLVIILFTVLVVLLRNHLPSPRSAGYPGVFVLNLIGSGGLVVPAPGLASVCFGASVLGLVPVLVGLLAATGETLGEITGYLAGVSGQGLVERLPLYRRLEPWVRRRGGIALFALAVIPNPIFDVAGVVAGGLRYPLHQFLGIIFVGKCIKDMAVAYGCLYIVDSIPRWMGG